MFNNIGLDIFIGLVFIYLLYSLLATIVAEIVATQIGLRARNLKEAVDRMLSDEVAKPSKWERFKDSLRLMKNPNNPRIEKFYNNPEIKYLGSTGIFKNPSSFKAETFSRTLFYELNGSGALDKSLIEKELQRANSFVPLSGTTTSGVTSPSTPTLDKQSSQFVLSLFHSSDGDLAKFKLHLEAWFDRTMDQATEWYKRKIQVILVVLGFFMAWIFNAGTFSIISKLSTDKDAREKLVQMSAAYLQRNKSNMREPNELERAKNMTKVEKQLQDDVSNANKVLGMGSWLPDVFELSIDPITSQKIFKPSIDGELLLREPVGITSETKITYHPNFWYKLAAFLLIFFKHFWGYLVTALAISLGAPFWFDLLNKLTQLRTSIKVPTNSTDVKDNAVSPLKRVG